MTCEKCNDTGYEPGRDNYGRLLEDGEPKGFCSCPAGLKKQFENVPGAVVVDSEDLREIKRCVWCPEEYCDAGCDYYVNAHRCANRLFNSLKES